DLERVQGAASARLDPADVARRAEGAEHAGIEERLPAPPALGNHELALARAVPVRLGLGRHRCWQWPDRVGHDQRPRKMGGRLSTKARTPSAASSVSKQMFWAKVSVSSAPRRSASTFL